MNRADSLLARRRSEEYGTEVKASAVGERATAAEGEGGQRLPVHSGLLPQIERALQKDMARFGVTRSFVIATVLAYHYDIEEQPDFRKA